MAAAVRSRFPQPPARDYSDGPQPFDQHVRGGSVEEKLAAMRLAQKKHEEALEDGDLPSLQTKPAAGRMMGGRLVNGQRTTTRPLSPPSQAGLGVGGSPLPPSEINKQRQFWSQFEGQDADDDGEEELEDGRLDNDDDVPDDERLDRKIKIQKRAVTRRRDDASDYSSAAEPSTVESSVEYEYAGPENNLCAQTLNAIGDICGITPGLESSPGKKQVARKHRIKPQQGETEEEHTAIEVEFVEAEPEPEPVQGDPVVEHRKNAYLSAMARRAKEDYQSRRDDAPSSGDDRSSVQGSATGSASSKSRGAKAAMTSNASTASVSSDVYNRFTASDKRKFLKLINNGLTPAEASEQVLQERQAKGGDKAAAEGLGAGKSPTRALGFGFWKRSPTRHSKKNDNGEFQFIEGAVLPSQSDVFDGVELASSGENLAGKVAITPVPDLNELRVIDETVPESESEAEAPFARSGINYYDAVRRREQEDSDGEPEEFPANTSSASGSKSKSRSLFANKLLPRFAPLDDEPKKLPLRPRSAPREGGRVGFGEPVVAGARDFGGSSKSPRDGLRTVSESGRHKYQDPELTAGLLAIAEIKEAIRSESAMIEDEDEELPSKPVHTDPKVMQTTFSTGVVTSPVPPVAQNTEVPQETKARATVLSLRPEPKQSFENGSTDTVSRIERDLLRPAPKQQPTRNTLNFGGATLGPSPKPGPLSPSTKIGGDDAHGPKANSGKPPINPTSSIPEKSDETVHDAVRKDSLDVSMHTYMSSAEMYTSNASVVSAGLDNMSVYTAGTGISAISQSSRVRRPGVAKERLAKAKQLEATPSRRGWHESMKAAAENQNRVWDPKLGWVDYQQQGDVALDAASAPQTSKIHLDLQKAVKNKQEETREAAEDGVGPAQAVAFPSCWADERRQMLDEIKPVESHARVESVPHTEEKGLDVPVAAILEPTSKSWVPSIRSGGSSVGKVEQLRVPGRGRPVAENIDRSETPTVELGPSSRVDNTDDKPVLRPTALPATTPGVGVADAKGEPIASRAVSASHIQKLGTYGDRMSRTEPMPSDIHTPSSNGEDDKYMQIGDNGSVRVRGLKKKSPHSLRAPMGRSSTESVLISDNYISDDDADDDKVPLLNETGSFGSIGMTESLVTPTVTVVKQRVNEEDLDLFQHEESKSPARQAAAWQQTGKTTGALQHVSTAQSVASAASSRPSGPVDLDDEVDESEVDEAHEENIWQIQEREALHDGTSFDLLTSSSGVAKRVPKLQVSKRDTSPVKARKGADDMFDANATPTTNTNPNVVTPDLSENVSAPRDDDVLQEEFDSIDSLRHAEPPTARNLGTRSPSGSYLLPSVRARLHQWEVRTGRSEDAVSEAASDASAEWKTLLDKKASAEVAVAAKQRQYGTHGDLATGSRSVQATVPVASAVAAVSDSRLSPDQDSLFHFRDRAELSTGVSKNSTNSANSASQESPIENEEDSDRDVSEAYGPRPGERSSFFKRLVECTAPVMPLKHACGRVSDSAPSDVGAPTHTSTSVDASNAEGSRSMTPSRATRDDITRNAETASSRPQDLGHLTTSSSLNADEKKRDGRQERRLEDHERPRSAPRPLPRGRREAQPGPSSVVSEDFGAKTAYLEAIAARAAVSKPRRSSSRHRSRSVSGSSVVSGSSSQHSEKWKAFLEKKRAGMTSPPKPRASADVSSAAEKFAAVKVEEMMLMMSTKHKAADYKSPNNPRFSSTASEDSSEDWRLKHSDSVKAAEDLAAARVEAMMAALAGDHLDEAEI